MYRGEEEHLRSETLRESVHVRQHESGLRVYFCPKPGFRKHYACFATNFGSIDSSFRRGSGPRLDVPDGVAHFLEHKLFEGEECNAFDLFSENGASSNAYTGFSATNYLFSCGRNFFENLGILIDFVQKPHFTDENVEKEKGIIGQEIRMYEDSPGWRIFFNLLEGLYHRHPVRVDIAGTVESISGIDKKVLYDCYETFYHPENMILFAVGDEDPRAYFDHVDRALEGRSYAPLGAVERILPEEPVSVADPRRELSLEVSMPRLLMGFKDTDLGGGRALLKRELETEILLEILFGSSSAPYQRWYEEQLIDDGFSASYTTMPTCGHSLVGGETPDPDRLAGVIHEELSRVSQVGLAAEDFERQKRATLGRVLHHFNSLEFIANNFCAYEFMDAKLFDLIDVLRDIRLEDLNERLRRHLVPERSAISILWPKRQAVA